MTNNPLDPREYDPVLGKQTPEFDNEQLKSAVGKDYTKLRNYLAAEKWKEADIETAAIMLVVAKRKNKAWLDAQSSDNFPCEGIRAILLLFLSSISKEEIYNFPREDLRTIDQLWVKYSNHRFGLSVQKKIYQGLGGTINYNRKIWAAFGDRVGWRDRRGFWIAADDITFKSNSYNSVAPQGHFPRSLILYGGFKAVFLIFGLNSGSGIAETLFSRRDL